MKKADLLVNLFTFRGRGIISEIISLKEEKLFSLMVSKVLVNGPLAMLLFWGSLTRQYRVVRSAGVGQT